MVKPKKRLGQHFLRDDNIARKIVDALSPETRNLLEIGPGTGVLSKFLLQSNIPNYYLIEVDDESVTYLTEKFPQFKENLLHTDFLKFDSASLFEGSFSIIGNFPYNISSQIIFKVLKYRYQVQEVVGMFQKEVAERIATPPGSKKYGILSVLTQAFYDIELLFNVSPGVFTPPPAVQSSVIRLRRNSTEQLSCDEDLFFKVVKMAFNQRRKTLRNSLKAFNFDNSENISEKLQQRAEQLSVEEFSTLTKAIVSS